MRLILDECIDRRLARDFVSYDVKTVPQMGWAGIKNGQLLALVEASFDVFIAVDRNLSFQLPQQPIAKNRTLEVNANPKIVVPCPWLCQTTR